MSHYGKSQYWEDRYSRNTQPFDWYQRFYAIKQPIRSFIPVRPQTKILIPGCGNSRLSQQMLQQGKSQSKSGYSYIVNIDNSVTCIKNMIDKYKQKTQKIKFQCMDAKNLIYQNQSFDAIIDKALFDCMMCSQNPKQNVYKMLCEFYRILKRKGVYMLLSYEAPNKRLPMLQKSTFEWKITIQKIPKLNSNINNVLLDQNQDSNYHYLYICVKQ